jgi:drug/metabolite transporter (DMT)-like permease
MQKHLRHKSDGYLAALACLLWSTAFVGIKVGYAAGANPLFFAGVRFFASGLVLIPIVLINEGAESFVSAFRNHAGFIVVIGLLQTSILYGAFYTGVGLIPASVAAIIVGAQPLLTSAAAHAFPPRERMNRRQWASLFLGLLGIVILSFSRNSSQGGNTLQQANEITGILFMLLALVSGTASSIWVSRTKREIQPLALSSGQFLAGGAVLLIVSLPLEGLPDITLDIKFWAALCWLIMVSSTGISLWFHLLRKPGSKAGSLSVWKFIIPVAGAAFGWLLISGDTPDPGSIAGMLLIGVSVLLYFRSA